MPPHQPHALSIIQSILTLNAKPCRLSLNCNIAVTALSHQTAEMC